MLHNLLVKETGDHSLPSSMSGIDMLDDNPADSGVFKTSSGRLKKVPTSYNQTRRCHNVLQKKSNLRTF